MTKYKTVYERFWEKVDVKNDINECWLWLGGVQKGTRGGYGVFSYNGKNRKSHQMSWILTFGDIPTIPNADYSHGTCVLHKCDNRLCVNPNHLFLGTNDDNMKDMVRKGRSRNVPRYGKDNWNTKLSEDKVRQIRNLYSTNKYLQKDLGKMFGVSQSAIGLIVRKEHWKWVE